MARIKLKKLTAIKGGNASQFANRKVTDGSAIPIEMDLDAQRVYVHFSPTKHMVVNLDRHDAFEYEIDDGSDTPNVLAVPAQGPVEVS
jgi:hypothetical protein